MHPRRRRQKLIQPALQIRLVGSFVGLSATALLLQFLLLGSRLVALASSMEGMGGELAAELPGLLIEALVFSAAVLLPVSFLAGIVLTHPIAGPAHRFEQHLQAIARGEDVGPCRIRKGDQFQTLCEALNAALDALRRGRGPVVHVSTDQPASDAREAA